MGQFSDEFIESSRSYSAYYTPTTDEALQTRAQRAKVGAVENEQSDWQAQAMDYFKGRVERLEENVNLLAVELDIIINSLERIEDALGEQSEPYNINVVVDMKGMAANIEEAVETAIKHQQRTGR